MTSPVAREARVVLFLVLLFVGMLLVRVTAKDLDQRSGWLLVDGVIGAVYFRTLWLLGATARHQTKAAQA